MRKGRNKKGKKLGKETLKGQKKFVKRKKVIHLSKI
jgi:hypothetical protein